MGSDQLATLIRAKRSAYQILEKYKHEQRYLKPAEAFVVYQELENAWDALASVTAIELEFQDDPTGEEDDEDWEDEESEDEDGEDD